jgi:hypothetical protein
MPVARRQDENVARRPRPNILGRILAVLGILVVLVIGLALSGLLDLDPTRDYGVLSEVGRGLQSLVGSARGAAGY